MFIKSAELFHQLWILIQNDWTTADILTKQKKGTPGQLWQCLYTTYTERTLDVYLIRISYKTNIVGFILHLERLLSSECDEKCKQKNFFIEFKKKECLVKCFPRFACVFPHCLCDWWLPKLIWWNTFTCLNFLHVCLGIFHRQSLKRF